MGLLETIGIFLLVSLVVTFAIKKLFRVDTFFIASLVRTKKPVAFFDWAARNFAFLDLFATIGLILGFGALFVDFNYGRKRKPKERALLLLASFALLSGLLVFVDFALGNPFSKNIMIGPAYPLLVASFGLLGFAGFALFSLALQAFDILLKYSMGLRGCPGVAPLVPGVEIPRVPVTPPLHAWLSLVIILVVHEAMHGILGRRHGFEIKSTGIILLGFLPIGAFVEPDENSLKRGRDESVLPFLAAGPMANLVLMLFAGLLLFMGLGITNAASEAFFPGISSQVFSGVKVLKVSESTSVCGTTYASPAFGVMQAGDRISSINGAEVTGPDVLFAELQKNRGEEKTFGLDRNGTIVPAALKPNELGQFGFSVEPIKSESFVLPESYKLFAFATYFSLDFIYWLLLLNFLVAVINFLPMSPFDGGRMGRIIFGQYVSDFTGKPIEESRQMADRLFTTAILSLLVINALPLFF